MSKNNVYLGRAMAKALLILLIGSTLITTTAALADATFTVKEATEIQAKIARAELEAKQREAENKAGGGRGKEIMLAPVSAPVRSDDLVFVGHYGIENDVKADFLLNNVLVTFSLKGKTEIGGWHIDKLTPRMARMCRTSAKRKNVGCKDIYLASESSAMAMQKTGNVYPETKNGAGFTPSSAPPVLPALPPLK